MNSYEETLNLGKEIMPNLHWCNSNYIISYYLKQELNINSHVLIHGEDNLLKIPNYITEISNDEEILSKISCKDCKFKDPNTDLRVLILKSGCSIYNLTRVAYKDDSNFNEIDNYYTAIGVEYEGFLEIYTSIIRRLCYIHIAIMRLLERDNEKKFSDFKNIERLFVGNKKIVTYKEGIKHLIKISLRLLDFSKYEKLLLKMEKLERDIIDSDIGDFRFGYDKYGNFSKLEKGINNIFLMEIINRTSFLVSIKEASEVTRINENTIKKACQENKLFNVKKVSKTWLVDCEEIKTYWKEKSKN